MTKELDLIEISSQNGINTTLDDVVGTKRVKVYPYKMINTSPYKKQIQPNTTSVISIGNDINLFKEKGLFIQEDENGLPYFELVAAFDTDLNTIDINTTSVSGASLRTIDNFMGITNHWNTEKSDMEIVCFMREPFDSIKFADDKQTGYILSSSAPARQQLDEAFGEELFEDVNSQVEELYFRSLDDIKKDFLNAQVVLVAHDFETSKMTVDDGTGKQVPGLIVNFENTTLIHSIKARTQTNKISKEIDLKLKEKLSPFKMTPIDNQDKVTVFADWFDYDMVMPLYLANMLVTPITLTDLQAKIIPGTSNPVMTAIEKELLEDVVALSYAYATRWTDFPVYTESEAKTITGVKPGQIKGYNTIGNAKVRVETLVGKDPMTEIDTFFETFIRKYPSKDLSIPYRTFKQLVSGLSRYVYSSYAIGQGQNAFNQIYLPWYVKPVTALELTPVSNKTSFLLSSDIKFEVQSEYFDITAGNLTPKPKTNISDVHMIQTDRKLTLPSLPDVINGVSKIPLAGDISTATSRDLMYMWYLPIKTQTEFQKLFLANAEERTIPGGRRTVTSPWIGLPVRFEYRAEGTTESEFTASKQAAITKDYLINVVGASTYTINDKGVYEERESSKVITYNSTESFTKSTSSFFKPWPARLLNALPTNTNFTYASLTTQDQKQAFEELVNWTWVEMPEFDQWHTPAAKNMTQASLAKVYWRSSGGGTLHIPKGEYSFHPLEARVNNLIYTSDIPTQVSNIDRTTLFDKDGWNNFIKHYLQLDGSKTTVTLYSEYGELLNDIHEITIASLWANEFTIDIGGTTITIPAINSDDETIGVQRILFT